MNGNMEELNMLDCKCPNCGRPSTLNVLIGCPTFDPSTGITTLKIQCLGCLKKYKEKRKLETLLINTKWEIL